MDKANFKKSMRKCLTVYLRKYRTRLGISQENMAEHLNVSLRAYSAMENGKYGCSVFSFISLLFMLSEEETHQLVRELKIAYDKQLHDAA